MRRSFDALAMMAEHVVRQDPFSGHLFVFINRLGDRTKILFWDRDGYCIYYKRLEEGTFQIPRVKGEGGVEIPMSELSLMLEGIDLASAKKRKRYSRPER
jgi:transposase